MTWGRGGHAAETGTLLSLSPPAPPALSLRLRLLCGARSVGPRSRPLSAPLTATMPPSALRRAVTLPQPPAAPHATAAHWSRQGGARGARVLSAGPPSQSPCQDGRRGGNRLRALAARSHAARGSSSRARERRARKGGPRALVRRVDPLCVLLVEGKRLGGRGVETNQGLSLQICFSQGNGVKLARSG